MRFWPVPRAEIPSGRDDRYEWLMRWWEQIDEWTRSTGRSSPIPGQVDRDTPVNLNVA